MTTCTHRGAALPVEATRSRRFCNAACRASSHRAGRARVVAELARLRAVAPGN
jgi:hypothetical protein